MEAKPGDWGLIREHIEEVLAGATRSLLITSFAGLRGLFKILGRPPRWRWS